MTISTSFRPPSAKGSYLAETDQLVLDWFHSYVRGELVLGQLARELKLVSLLVRVSTKWSEQEENRMH